GTMAHSALRKRPGIQNAIQQMHVVQSAIAEWAPLYESRHEFMGEHPNITVASIRGGMPWRLSRNPIECRLYLDIRTVPGQTADTVKRELRETLSRCCEKSGIASPEVEVYLNDPPTAINSDLPVVNALRQSHQEVLGANAVMVTRRPAADSTHLSRYDVPCAVYGPGGKLHPDSRGQMHAAGEHIHLDDVVNAAKVYL